MARAKFNFVPVGVSLEDRQTKIQTTENDKLFESSLGSSHGPQIIVGFKYLAFTYLAFVLFIGLVFLLPVVAKIAVWFLIPWVLISPRRAIEALAIGVLIKYLNPFAFSVPGEIGIIGWLILLFAFLRHIFFVPQTAWRHLLPILIFVLFTAILSVVTSSAPLVSIMKLLSFAVGTITVLVVFERLDAKDVLHIWYFLSAMVAAIVTLSLLTITQPGISYALNGVGFQGIINHPQSIGALMTPFICWLLAGVFFRKGKQIWIPITISISLIFVVIISQTRTSMAAVALALVVTFIFFLFRHRVYEKWGTISRTLISGLLALLLLGLVLVSYAPAQQVFMNYVFKRDSQDIGQALSSRSAGIESQWNHFLREPIAGFGFGVYPGKNFAKDVRTFMGIPISAPVEKGFLPTALLEEVGILGAIAFFFLLKALVGSASRAQDIRWLCLFFGCLFVNVGEAVFFSVGGIGLLYWLMIGLSSVAHKMNNVVEIKRV